MVFNQILKGITNALDNHKSDTHRRPPLYSSPELAQGRTYLNDRRSTARVIKPHSVLLEGLAPMNNGPVRNLNQQEYNSMQTAKADLSKKLSKYGRDRHLFYELYGKVAAEVVSCRQTCEKTYSQPDFKYQKQSCLAGCDLSLPDVKNEVAVFSPETGKKATIASCGDLKNNGPRYCKSWVSTEGCSKYGPDSNSALTGSVENDCNTAIPSNVSGYCVCANGEKKAYVDCGHSGFNCNEACAPTSQEYTYEAPPKPCGPNSVPQLISCSKPGYCYNAITGESVSTYISKGDPYPANRKIGGRSYYFRQTGRGAQCPASSYKAPFCADPTYNDFIVQGCSQANTKQTCAETVKAGWVPDGGLCKTLNPNYKQAPCFVDPIVRWIGNDTIGNYALTKHNPQGVKIPNRDVGRMRGSPSLYYYTAPPKGENLSATSIVKSVSDSAGNLYLFIGVTPPSFVMIPHAVFDTPGFDSNASCFKNAKFLYVGPVPGTKYKYSNNYRHVGGKIGKWGGGCRCPDGSIYVVGDNHNHCGSLACEGGTVMSCSKNGAKNAGRTGWAVTCDPGPAEGFTGTREGLVGSSLAPPGGKCLKNAQCASAACDLLGLYKNQATGASCKNRCVDESRTKCPSLGNSLPAGLSGVPTGSDLVSTCRNAFPYPNQSAELARDKRAKDEDNRELITLAKQMQSKLDSAHRQLDTIGTDLPGKTQTINSNLKTYQQVYDRLQKAKGTEANLAAMMQDGKLLTGSSSLSYYAWLVLAVSLLIAAVRQTSK